RTGEDKDSLNWGSNILLANEDRVQDYGNEIAQGIDTKINTIGIDVSYQLKPGFFIDLFYQHRSKTSALPEYGRDDNYLGTGIRWNLGRRWQQF
ncbi:MAG: hypothetical protein HKN76_14120, partial [Saprospiraceae bacterium]|nr:hypothetical protein [Saprospiraceae bacterium]